MTYNIGDPDHIGVHNQLTSDVQTAAAERGIDVDLPPQRNLGDNGHVKDHNLITDALAAVVAGGGGKVLQVVRATDKNERTTTSNTFISAGISVTITPKSDTSSILVIWASYQSKTETNGFIATRITKNGNVVSGAENTQMGSNSTGAANQNSYQTLIGYDAPMTTNAVTYEGEYRAVVVPAGGIEAVIFNNATTGQMYAIELSDVEEVVVSP